MPSLVTREKPQAGTVIAQESAGRRSERERVSCGSHPLRPADEGRRAGGPQALTSGGSYTSSRSSIWKIDTSSFRAVATIAI
jgi:hypothetical protein